MKKISIARLIRNSVSSDSTAQDFLVSYLEPLNSNLKQVELNVRNLTIQILFLFMIFELITRAAITEATVGSFKVQDLSLIQKLIPIAIAYLYYETTASLAMRMLVSDTYAEIVRIAHKPIYENRIYHIMFPISSLGAEQILAEQTVGFGHNVIVVLGVPVRIIILLSPLVFIGYSIYELFSVFGTADSITWLSIIFSLLFSIQGFTIFLQAAGLREKAFVRQNESI